MPREAVADLPLTVAQTKWIRNQLRRFPRVPTTNWGWEALRDAFVTQFPNQRTPPTVKQYKKAALRIDMERQDTDMGLLVERYHRHRTEAELEEINAIKGEMRRRDDHTYKVAHEDSEEEERQRRQTRQTRQEDDEEQKDGDDGDASAATTASASVARGGRAQQRTDVLNSRLATVEALLSTKEQELQQWKTKYEEGQAQLTEKDAALRAAQDQVQKLEAAIAEARAAAAATAPPPPPPQQQPTVSVTAAPVAAAPVAPGAPNRQLGSGTTFVINLNLGDIMRATGA